MMCLLLLLSISTLCLAVAIREDTLDILNTSEKKTSLPSDQRPKNAGGRVALPPGRFGFIWKI